MTPPTRVADGPEGLPYGARVIQAASADPGGWLLLGAGPGAPSDRLSELLDGPYGIGAVIPGRSPGQLPADAPSRDTPVATAPGVAIPARLVLPAGPDPRESDRGRVVAEILAQVRRSGLRVVADSHWVADDPITGAGSDTRPLRMLVATGALSSSYLRTDAHAVWSLIETLAARAGHSEIVVVSAERCWPGRDVSALAGLGVRVVDGPVDWSGIEDRVGGQFSHVVMTASGALAGARQWVTASQPHASRILFLPSLPFREVTALIPVTPADELGGLREVRIAVEGWLGDLGRWSDAIWCGSEDDVSFVSVTAPDTPVIYIPPTVAAEPGEDLERRSGIVAVAAEGHDVIACNEDATVRVLGRILPQIRWRDATAECTVISDRPTPMLQSAARAAGATIRPCAELDPVLASARLLLSAHPYGGGQPGVLTKALAAGLPFLATPSAAGNLYLGDLAGQAVFTADADLATRGWQLLSDDRRWRSYREAQAALVATHYSPQRRADALRRALAPLGIDGGSGSGRSWPPSPRPDEPQARYRPPVVALRPGAPPEERVEPEDDPTDDHERYRLWQERYGVTPAVLAALRDETDALTVRPVVSVILVAIGAPAGLVRDSIDSVRAQVYDGWHLCVARDPADRAVAEILADLEPEAGVTVVDSTAGGAEAANAALATARGDHVAFLDPGTALKPHALAQAARWIAADPAVDVIYSDDDRVDDSGVLHDPHPKPDWSPDHLTGQNYIGRTTVMRRDLVVRAGGLRPVGDGDVHHDLLLRLAELTDRIAHIPEPLYTLRSGADLSGGGFHPQLGVSQTAVSEALVRRGYSGQTEQPRTGGPVRPRYAVPGQPHVAIIIPTRDNPELLERCLLSILKITTYKNYEIVIIDNDTVDRAALELLAAAPGRVIRYPHRFNYARMMNLAARSVECDALLFLNNDTAVIAPDWIDNLLEHAMRPEVGVVGGRLFFGDGEPQHEGITVGTFGGWAANLDFKGFWGRGEVVRNATAITGACTMIRPSVYWRVGGNDERLRVAYNDVDLCMRIHQAGYEVVYTPYAELYHYEGSSRSNYEHPEDGPLFGIRWRPKERVDPYYSPMLSDFSRFRIKV